MTSLLVMCAVLAVTAASIIWNYSEGTAASPVATVSPIRTREATEVPTLSVAEQVAAILAASATVEMPARTIQAVIEVTSTPTPTPHVVVENVYYEVPVEVTRLVEVPAPTFTPTPPVARGIVRLCVYLEGATGLWIDGAGVAGNSCTDVYSTSPVQNIDIEIHR
jgi:hypothetical protein